MLRCTVARKCSSTTLRTPAQLPDRDPLQLPVRHEAVAAAGVDLGLGDVVAVRVEKAAVFPGCLVVRGGRRPVAGEVLPLALRAAFAEQDVVLERVQADREVLERDVLAVAVLGLGRGSSAARSRRKQVAFSVRPSCRATAPAEEVRLSANAPLARRVPKNA